MKPERIAVAMSGGVDSSVAAALLLEQGLEVVGLTMQLWPRDADEESCPGLRSCCGIDAIEDARRVARALGIRHYVIEMRDAFQRDVIDHFCEEYAKGRTPNPCLRCNTYIKFGDLLQRAREIGANRLATGHYARLSFDEESGRWAISRAADRRKDQSYALYDLSQEQLAHASFPIGGIRKTQTRAQAAKLGLSVSDKPDSQQICFVGTTGYQDYLMKCCPQIVRPGPIVDRWGKQIGRHRGIPFYTVGQRQGLRVARGKPLYVIAIDAPRNQVVVGGEEDLLANGLILREVNYVALAKLPPAGDSLDVKIRSTGALVSCTAYPRGKTVAIRFAEPQRAVTPGQAAVCYRGEALAFGGIIDSSLGEEE